MLTAPIIIITYSLFQTQNILVWSFFIPSYKNSMPIHYNMQFPEPKIFAWISDKSMCLCQSIATTFKP